MAFQKAHGGYTVFGDVILKDKIIVYDLARRRLGWSKRDCSLPMNINITFGNDKGKSSSRNLPVMLLIGTLLMHLFLCVI
ncbi:aspartyl protease APCB1-like [Malus sylvestris]|uniref:aspartyl protease APCB1-like n=1 Tax=Malus sylvestris TaxID=3752 RepID=UPI0021ABA7FC|nr:aspartyl protease APCB1-like [Malus sylvestris]